MRPFGVVLIRLNLVYPTERVHQSVHTVRSHALELDILLPINAAQHELPITFAIDMSLAYYGDQNTLFARTPLRSLPPLSAKAGKSGKSSNLSAR